MNRTLASLSLHLSDDTRIDCCVYPTAPPILTITFARGYLHLSNDDRDEVTEKDLATARALAEHAQTYLAECERLHAAGKAAV